MTDAAIGSVRPHAPSASASAALLRKRYRAEARFKAYGIAAIVFAALALVVLVGDILIKAWPAFTITELQMEVTVSAEDLGVTVPADPATLARADFVAPIRQALLKIFPEAQDNRRSRQALYGLLSSDAGAGLRSLVLSDPSVIGTTVSVPVLLSDDADLFYKGYMTKTTTDVARGTGSPSATSGSVTIFSSANDFANELVTTKLALSIEARRLRTEVTRFDDLLKTNEAALQEATAAAAAAGAGDAMAAGNVAKLQQDRASIEATIAGYNTQIADLETRYNTPSRPETISDTVPSFLVEINGGVVKVNEIQNDRVIGETVIPLQSTDAAAPGTWRVVSLSTPEASRKLSDLDVVRLETLQERGMVSTRFNTLFFTTGDSREAELAGILGALVGSALTMLVTLTICLPIGVAAAIYLEEFAPKNRLTGLIEVNINNLAAVPSIVFGLLGLAVFLNFFGMPRSAPLVGGLVLALLVLPTIIIASRAALKAVPPSIREGALGVGASHQQAVFHHVLPLAMPGILTGTIIGMGHALGETAPLLLIGMVAFIVDVPDGLTQAATVLPVQIYLWSDLPEVGFQAKTSAAIIVLLLFLFLMNGAAILLRKKFERRW